MKHTERRIGEVSIRVKLTEKRSFMFVIEGMRALIIEETTE